MINPTLNRLLVLRAAVALEDLRHEVVLVGGCALGFLLTDEGVRDPSPTKDADFIVEVRSRSELQSFEERLQAKGFRHEIMSNVICRWTIPDEDFDSLILDFMPTDESIFGFGNPWYKEAAKAAVSYQLEEGISLAVITSPYFLATKIKAVFERGLSDLRFSRDLEDIVTLFDGRPELVGEVRRSSSELIQYIACALKKLRQKVDFDEAIDGLMPYSGEIAFQRSTLVRQRIQALADQCSWTEE